MIENKGLKKIRKGSDYQDYEPDMSKGLKKIRKGSDYHDYEPDMSKRLTLNKIISDIF